MAVQMVALIEIEYKIIQCMEIMADQSQSIRLGRIPFVLVLNCKNAEVRIGEEPIFGQELRLDQAK
jgi:hypothetical protein